MGIILVMKVGSMSKDEVRPIEREASQQPLFFEKIMDFEDSPVWGFFFFSYIEKINDISCVDCI